MSYDWKPINQEIVDALTNDNLWLIDSNLKYLKLTIDTRSGGEALIFDRDGREVGTKHLLDTHIKAIEIYGEPTRNKKAQTSVQEKAWSIYCEETAGALSAVDFWEHIPEFIQKMYLAKARIAS